ncbi:MAG: hypothetical protein ACM31L_16135 [Actinomycetota bacterium]
MTATSKTAIALDLMAEDRYPPLATCTPAQLFELAVKLAQALDNVTVRAPVGTLPDEAVVVTSRLMHKAGAALF